MKTKLSFLPLFFCFALICAFCSNVSAENHPYEFSKLMNVVTYITNRYNNTYGLCSNSEDTGYYYGTYGHYYQLYFLYSDNLFAYHCLEYFSPLWANKLEAGLNKYVYPRDTLGFGVLFGENIGFVQKDAVEHFVYNASDGSLVIYERHEGSPLTNWHEYADRVIYQAMQEYQYGSEQTAFNLMHDAVLMYDGKGLYDKGTIDAGWYSNYKLGLLLYAIWFMNYPTNITITLETEIWDCQDLDTGGIHSATNSTTGEHFGTSNIETSSICILPYTLSSGDVIPTSKGSQLWYQNPFVYGIVVIAIVGAIILIQKW